MKIEKTVLYLQKKQKKKKKIKQTLNQAQYLILLLPPITHCLVYDISFHKQDMKQFMFGCHLYKALKNF